MDKNALWNLFEQFYLDYASGYWSAGRIDLPYGSFLPLHPDDDASMLYGVDLSRESPAKILSSLEQLGTDLNLPIGFYITPSWKGDIDAFKSYLIERGFHESHRMIPHILDDLSVADTIKDSGFTVKTSDDPHLVATIFNEVFKGAEDFAAMIVNCLEKPQTGPVKTQFFTAYAPDGTPAGIAACNYDHQFGYMNCLAVREPYRMQGLASHLVKARLNHLRAHNVPTAVTIVAWKNSASLNTQAKIGYKKLIEASIWKPRDSQYHKTI